MEAKNGAQRRQCRVPGKRSRSNPNMEVDFQYTSSFRVFGSQTIPTIKSTRHSVLSSFHGQYRTTRFLCSAHRTLYSKRGQPSLNGNAFGRISRWRQNCSQVQCGICGAYTLQPQIYGRLLHEFDKLSIAHDRGLPNSVAPPTRLR